MKTIRYYKYNTHRYAIENLTSSRWQMIATSDNDPEPCVITDPSLIIRVLTQGVEIVE